MLYMAAVAWVITFFYILILRWIAKPLLYVSLLLILVLFLALGGFCFLKARDEFDVDTRNGLYAGAVILWIFSLLYMVFLCCQWKNITLGASILQAASDFLTSNSRIVLVPVVIYVLMIPVLTIWLFSTIHIASMGTPVYVPDSYIGTMEYENFIIYIFLFMLFGLFWVIAFMNAYQQFTIATTTCMWYFSG